LLKPDPLMVTVAPPALVPISGNTDFTDGITVAEVIRALRVTGRQPELIAATAQAAARTAIARRPFGVHYA
jgi:hypothetical protein